MLGSDLLMTHYNTQLSMIISADATYFGVGVVILHILPNGSEKVIPCDYRTLTTVIKLNKIPQELQLP